MTSNGQGTFFVTLSEEDFGCVTKVELLRSGDDIVQTLQVTDADNGVLGTFYSSKYTLNFADYQGKASSVTKLSWNCNTAGTMTITGIRITSSVITATNPHLTPLTEAMFNSSYCEYNIGVAQGPGSTIYGDGNVNSDNYADLSGYDALYITGTPGQDVRLLFNWGATKNEVIQTLDADGFTAIDLTALPNQQLNAFKFRWDGKTAIITSINLYKENVDSPYNYVMTGAGVLTASVQAALADETATAIDATGITKATELATANPNCLIVANERMVTNSQNVIVDGTCANLVLTDKKPFKAPATFTATKATLNREVSNGGFATICAPFAISGATGTFYQPSELTVEGTLNFATEATPAAGKAYLFKASADVTSFTGSGTVVAEPIDNGTGVVMKGTFSQIAKVDEGSYILSGSSLYKVDSDVALTPFRAYFEVPEVAPARINLHFDEETTGINAVNSSMYTVEGYYNLNGQRVAQPTKGLYIVNGKKTILK